MSQNTKIETTKELIAAAQAGDANALSRLVSENSALVWSIVKRFYGRAEPDDLFQLGSIGLIKAVQAFDASMGTELSTYAVPKIIGEIKRFLRDDGMIKVSRVLKQNAYRVAQAKELLGGTDVHISQICELTGLSAEEIAACEQISTSALSLDTPFGDDSTGTLGDVLPSTESEDKRITKIAIEQAVSRLPPREKAVVQLRFFKDFTQQKTADVLGLSQVQISRCEKKALALMREQLK